MQAHQMTRDSKDKDGAERWRCPTCGRVVVVTWNPFGKLTVVAGDELATYTAGTGVLLDVGTIDDGEMSDGLKEALEGVDLGEL